MNNDFEIEFDRVNHIYSVDGEVLPSITQLVSSLYGDTYERVNTKLLKRASEYGTLVHSEIERYFKHNDRNYLTLEAKTFIERVVNEFNINYVLSEKRVALVLNERIVACGTLDLLAYFDNTLYLVDFKTTSVIHLQEVILQLNLYAKGLLDTYDIEVNKLAVIQLKNDKYVVKELPKLCNNVIDEKLKIALAKYESKKD